MTYVGADGSQTKEQLEQQRKKAAEEAKAKEAESLEASSGSTEPETAPESTNESRAQAAAKREQNTSGSGQNKETLLTQTVRGYTPEAEPQTQATALLTHLKNTTSEDTTNDDYSDYNEGSSSESTQRANPALQLVQTQQNYRNELTQAQQAVRQLSNEQKQKIIDLSDALIRLGKPEEVTQALKDLFLQPQKAQEILSNLEETKNQADIEAFEVQAQNLRLNVTEEIKNFARESRDIIQARNILLQANSQTKYPSQEEKDLYLKATEAMLSGQEQLTDIILGNLMLGNIEEAQRAYQENLESLSPEQRLAKMQTLHTAKITENARTVETALELKQKQFKKRMTSVRDPFQNIHNCLGQRSNQQHEIGPDPFRPSLMNNNSTGKRGLQDLLKAAQESTEDKPLDVYEFVNQSFRSPDLQLQIETPSLSSALSQRAELKDIQLEATQLAQAGNIEMAAALLNGDISITDIETAKLQQSNPYAARLTAPHGSEVSDEDMITLEREQLEKLINQNRMAMAHLENQRNSLFSRLEENPLGEDKPAQLEHHALLSAQQKQLERQTQRLFQTHDRVTKLVNEGNYAGARDILEGRTSVLAERQEAENLQSAAQLADRHFTRTAAEEEKYQETQKVLKALQQEQEDQSHLENGTRRNLSQTYKDLRENSGWVARWGGLTEQLQKQRDLERGRLDQFERQREQVDRLKDTARSLIAQGKYDEATDLLAKTIDFSSESFQGANSAMIKNYQAINEELDKFDQKFKDEAVTVAKHVAIGAVAIGVTLALAPATGGLSLAAAGTMIGGGTLAGAGVGLAVDLIDDGLVDTFVFGDTLAEGFGYNEEDGYWGIAKEFGGKQYRNVQSAFTASLTFTGATSLSRPLIARGFSAYKSTGLSTLFTAPATSSVNLGFDQIAAEAEYLDMSEEQRAAYSSKAKFLESRGLDPASMFKRVAVDTGTEVLSSLVGVKIDRFFSRIKGVQGQAREQAAAQLKKELLIDFTRNGVESASDIAFGLIAEYMTNPEGITSQGLALNIVQALVGRKIGDFTAQSFESRRSMPDLSGVRESNSLPDGIQAQTTVRYDNDGKLLGLDVDASPDLLQRAHEGDSDARAKVREETEIHAMQKPIDPLKTADGAPMPENQYLALRAQRELLSQAAAKALQAQAEGANTIRQTNDATLAKINEQINTGDFDGALKTAQENGIDQTYLNQYGEDYKRNSNPDREFISETNYATKDSAETTTNLTEVQRIAAQEEISPDDITALKENLKQMDLDSLNSTQKDQLYDLMNNLKAKGVNDLTLIGELAYLSGNGEMNATQLMASEIDQAFTRQFEDADRDPQFIQKYFDEDLGPRVEAQQAIIQELLANNADQKTLSAALFELEKLAIKKGGITAGHIMNLGYNGDVDISPSLRSLDAHEINALRRSLSDADGGRTRVEDYVHDLSLSEEQKQQRAEAIDDLDIAIYEHERGDAETSPEKLQEIIDSIDPNTLTRTKVQEIKRLLESAQKVLSEDFLNKNLVEEDINSIQDLKELQQRAQELGIDLNQDTRLREQAEKFINPEHIDLMASESGLSVSTLIDAEITTIQIGEHGSALSIPRFDENGKIASHQIRLDEATRRNLEALDSSERPEGYKFKNDGEAHKYNIVGEDGPYYPKGHDPDSQGPMFITEGAKKALKLQQEIDASNSGDSQAVGLSGITEYNKLLADLKGKNLEGRQMYIVFDGDTQSNSAVRKSQMDLYQELKARGADVHIIELPENPGNTKSSGIDDYLVHHGLTGDDAIQHLTDMAQEVRGAKTATEGANTVTQESQADFRRTRDNVSERANNSFDNLNEFKSSQDTKARIQEIENDRNSFLTDDDAGKFTEERSDYDTAVDELRGSAQELENLTEIHGKDSPEVKAQQEIYNKAVADLELKYQKLYKAKFDDLRAGTLETLAERAPELVEKHEAFNTLMEQLTSLDPSDPNFSRLQKKATQLRTELKDIYGEVYSPLENFNRNKLNNKPDLDSISFDTIEEANNRADQLKQILQDAKNPDLVKLRQDVADLYHQLTSHDKLFSHESFIKNAKKFQDAIKSKLSNDPKPNKLDPIKSIREELSRIAELQKYAELNNEPRLTEEGQVRSLGDLDTSQKKELLSRKAAQIIDEITAGGNLSLSEKQKLYDRLDSMLNPPKENAPDIDTYLNQVESFMDDLKAIGIEESAMNLIQEAERKHREVDNFDNVEGFLIEAQRNRRLIESGEKVVGLGVKQLDGDLTVLDANGKNLFEGIDFNDPQRALAELEARGLIESEPKVKRGKLNTDYAALSLKAGSESIYFDKTTGKLIRANGSELTGMHIQHAEGGMQLKELEIDTVLERGEGENRETILVEQKVDLETFLEKNPFIETRDWDNPDQSQVSRASGQSLTQLERQILLANHRSEAGNNTRAAVMMDISAIRNSDGTIDLNHPQARELSRILEYAENLPGGNNLIILDETGVDISSNFR